MSTLKKQLQNMNSNSSALIQNTLEKNMTLSTRPTTRELTNHSRINTPDSTRICRTQITETPIKFN